MAFFKILQNKTVVDAGFTFLKWNEKYGDYFRCETDEAQFVLSYNGDKVYRDEWMKQAPAEANGYTLAEIAVIDQTEYDEIVALLEDGEEVPVEESEMIEPETVPEETDEKPLTIAEMREIIEKQQEQIALLTGCILEMSEIVYGE